MLHTLFLFRRSIYEVYSENSQALLLGARRALFRVSSVAVLLACMIQPSFAEFTNTDSNNLSSINTKLSTISSTLSSVYSRLGDILNAFTSSPMAINIGSIVNNTQVLAQKLDTLISKIDSLSGTVSSDYRLVLDTPFSFDSINYSQASILSGSTWVGRSPVDGVAYFPSVDSSQVNSIQWLDRPVTDSQLSTISSSVTYTVSISFPGEFSTTPTIRFSVGGFDGTVSNVSYSNQNNPGNNGYQTTVLFDVVFSGSSVLSFPTIWFDSGQPSMVSGGWVRGSIVQKSMSDQLDDNLSSAVDPDQSAVNDSIGSAVSDLDDFDSQIFADFDKYKADLDFGLSAWGEAAAGISYIGNIFMIIWDNSPNQVIVLSLMLGLCGLVLGRGARLARAARRSDRGADDG